MSEAQSSTLPAMNNAASRPLSEAELDFLEEQIPELAVAAGKAAFVRTLASGQSTLVAEGDAIYEVFPDGSKRLVKKLASSIAINLAYD